MLWSWEFNKLQIMVNYGNISRQISPLSGFPLLLATFGEGYWSDPWWLFIDSWPHKCSQQSTPSPNVLHYLARPFVTHTKLCQTDPQFWAWVSAYSFLPECASKPKLHLVSLVFHRWQLAASNRLIGEKGRKGKSKLTKQICLIEKRCF